MISPVLLGFSIYSRNLNGRGGGVSPVQVPEEISLAAKWVCPDLSCWAQCPLRPPPAAPPLAEPLLVNGRTVHSFACARNQHAFCDSFHRPHALWIIRYGWSFFTGSPAAVLYLPASVLRIPPRAMCLNHTSFPVVPLTNSLCGASYLQDKCRCLSVAQEAFCDVGPAHLLSLPPPASHFPSFIEPPLPSPPNTSLLWLSPLSSDWHPQACSTQHCALLSAQGT